MTDLFFADLVREVSSSTGAGPLALDGAPSGYRTFAGVVPPGASFHYSIVNSAVEREWEIGIGSLDGHGRLTRSAITSSNADAGVDLTAGVKYVTLTVASEWFAARENRSGHGHSIGQIGGLDVALAGKQDSSDYVAALHMHAMGDVAGLQDELDSKQPTGDYLADAPLDGEQYARQDGAWSPVSPGLVAMPDGTAEAPGWPFANDLNTGFYRPGENSLVISIGGSDRMRFSANGNVGIGTGSPDEKLHVAGSSQVDGTIKLGASPPLQTTLTGGNAFIISHPGIAAAGLRVAPIVSDIYLQNTVTSGNIRFSGLNASNLTGDFVFHGTGAIVSSSNNVLDIGSSSKKIANYYGESATLSDLTISTRLKGGFGAKSTALGSPDWDVETASGFTPRLFSGSDANGPPLGGLHYGLNITYLDFAGGSNLTQLAIPYNSTQFFGFRYRYNNVWSVWRAVLAQNDSGNFLPPDDNASYLGGASNRFGVVYAGTGSINTSDEREKTWRGGLTDSEYEAGRQIIDELGCFQFNDAIEKKGPDGARYHFGARAQRIWAIMADHGLVDPISGDGRPGNTPYAFLCYDEWAEETEPVLEPVEIAAVLDDNGNEIEAARTEQRDTGETRVTVEAGNRFGLRYDELNLFLIACQHAKIAAMAQQLDARR